MSCKTLRSKGLAVDVDDMPELELVDNSDLDDELNPYTYYFDEESDGEFEGLSGKLVHDIEKLATNVHEFDLFSAANGKVKVVKAAEAQSTFMRPGQTRQTLFDTMFIRFLNTASKPIADAANYPSENKSDARAGIEILSGPILEAGQEESTPTKS